MKLKKIKRFFRRRFTYFCLWVSEDYKNLPTFRKLRFKKAIKVYVSSINPEEVKVDKSSAQNIILNEHKLYSKYTNEDIDKIEKYDWFKAQVIKQRRDDSIRFKLSMENLIESGNSNPSYGEIIDNEKNIFI